jgi:two-component system, NarL family, invasion response regulator UvrY
MTVRILIADDSAILRKAVRELLSQIAVECTVCGEASDGAEAMQKASELNPDVMLLDLSLPITNGVEVAKHVKKNHPAMEVLLMSAQDEAILRHLADSFGLKYGLSKARLSQELIPVLREIANQRSGKQPPDPS